MNEKLRPRRRRQEKTVYHDKLNHVLQGLGARYEGIINLAQQVPLLDGEMGHWQLHEVDGPEGWFGIQPFLVNEAGQRVQDAEGQDVVYTSQVTYYLSDTDVLRDPESGSPINVPVILNPNGYDKLRGGGTIEGTNYRDTRGNNYILPDDSYIHPSQKTDKLRAASDIVTPTENSEGLRYLKASPDILVAENSDDLPQELAIPKQLIDDVVLLSIVSEGDYRRYRQVYPHGELTEKQFNEKYQASVGKEFGNALVYTPDGSIIGYPGEEIIEGNYQSVEDINFNDARKQRLHERSGLTAVGKVHSHPSQERQPVEEVNEVRKNIPIRYGLVRGVARSVSGTLRALDKNRENPLVDREKEIFNPILPHSVYDLASSWSTDVRLNIVVSKERIYIALKTKEFAKTKSKHLFSPRWSYRRELADHLRLQKNTVKLFLKDRKEPVQEEEIEEAVLEPALRTAQELGFAIYTLPTPQQEVPEEGLVAKKVA